MHFLRLILVALVSSVAGCPMPAPAAWGAGSCSSVGGACDYAGFTGWRQNSSDANWYGWFENGVQKAAYNKATKRYVPYDAATKTWGEAQTPPWEKESKVSKSKVENKAENVEPGCVVKDGIKNYGLETEKLNGTHEEYRINGKRVSKVEATQALAGSLPNDADHLRLTVIGNDADRLRVLADLANQPALTGFKSRLVVQDYPPEHWTVARAGFVTTGQPTIYLQTPSGKVLHRQDDYSDGAAGLSAALERAEAIRKPDPNYDRRRDPDLRKPAPLDVWRRFQGLTQIPLPVWILAISGLLVYFRKVDPS